MTLQPSHCNEHGFRVGDRVQVHPQSVALERLMGEIGTVEKVIPDDGGILSGALYVRLDCDGETLGIGPDAVTRVDA